MTLKEAKKGAISEARNHGRYVYLTISKQTEIGWYVEWEATQRTVFLVYKDGSLELHCTDFARNYQREHFPNIKMAK